MRARLEKEVDAAKATLSEAVQKASVNAGGAQEAYRAIAEVRKAGSTRTDSEAEAEAASQADSQAMKKNVQGSEQDSIGAGCKVVVPKLGPDPLEVESRRKNQLFVVYGGLKMKVKVSEVSQVVLPSQAQQQASNGKFSIGVGLSGAGSQGAKKGGRDGGGSRERSRVAVKFESNTLDVRGRRAADVGPDLARCIDANLAKGSLWVVHGHGTGSLRRKVHELLAEDPMVDRFEDAPASEGGSGCTVAYLR